MSYPEDVIRLAGETIDREARHAVERGLDDPDAYFLGGAVVGAVEPLIAEHARKEVWDRQESRIAEFQAANTSQKHRIRQLEAEVSTARQEERSKVEAALRKAVEALEVAALGGYDENLLPEDTVANPYEERGLVRVIRDISDEFDCHMTPEGVDFVRTAIEDGRAALQAPIQEEGEAEDCKRCGRRNSIWFAPSPLWNAVIRGGSIDGEPKYGDMVCASCFIWLAEDQGIAHRFCVSAEEVEVELETVTPSGRVWDEDRNRWSDPSPQPIQDGQSSPGEGR